MQLYDPLNNNGPKPLQCNDFREVRYGYVSGNVPSKLDMRLVLASL